MNKASIVGLSVLGALVLTRCGGSTEPPPGSGGASGSAGSIGAGGSNSAGSTAAGGTTSSGFGGFATGGTTNTGGFAGTLGVGGAPGSGGAPGRGFDAGFNNASCPAVEPASGSACTAGMGAGVCNYGSDLCFCGGNQTWNCIQPGAVDAGGGFNFDAAGGFTFDAGGFGFDGAVPCPANQPNGGAFCFSANQSCAYGAVTCTCEPPDGGLPVNRWSCP